MSSSLKDRVKRVGVGLLVVVMDFQHFRHKSPARQPFDLDHYVERFCDVTLNRAVRYFYAALQHTGCES